MGDRRVSLRRIVCRYLGICVLQGRSSGGEGAPSKTAEIPSKRHARILCIRLTLRKRLLKSINSRVCLSCFFYRR